VTRDRRPHWATFPRLRRQIERLLVWIGQHDRSLVAAVVIAGVAVAVFLELGEYAVSEETAHLDRALLLALRSPGDASDPIGPTWFEEMGRDVTALGGMAVLFLFTAAALGYALMRREKLTAILLVASVGGGMLVSLLLKDLYDRARPDLVPHGSVVHTQSFPSGHSMMSAITYLTLAALLVRVQPSRLLKLYVLALGILLTGLVGVSRVYLGVHWPSDVLAGWAVGAAWAAMTWFVTARLQAREGVEPEAEGVPTP
jgi:undecaprenyl-diphosphatase